MISILLLSGVQMLMLWIIGEYLWRNYHEARKLPNFIIEHVNEQAPGPSTAAPSESAPTAEG